MKKKTLFIVGIILFISVLLTLSTKVSAVETATTTDGDNTIQWSYNLSGDSIIDLKCTNTAEISGNITIPDTIDGHKVLKIGNNAFKEATGLTGVTISNNVTEIGSAAFYKCTGLTNVNIGNSVTKIGDNCFYNCTGIKTITLPESLIEIGREAFQNCRGLSKITIPDNVTTIGDGAFSNCTGLKEVELSEKLTTINAETFLECTGLKTIVIPENVTSILGGDGLAGGAFEGCTSLKTVLIPSSVNYIAKKVFNKRYSSDVLDVVIFTDKDSVAYEYAIDKGMKYNYTEMYGKTEEGADITGPKTTSILVTNGISKYWESETSMYKVPSGAEFTIDVNFDEEIAGDEMPTLVLSCGTGADIKITDGTIGKDKITYVYKVKSSDKGTLQVKELTGGNITDVAGNTATLEKHNLKTFASLGDVVVYLNGEEVVIDNKPAGTTTTNEDTTKNTKEETKTTTDTKTATDTKSNNTGTNTTGTKTNTNTGSNSTSTAKDSTTLPATKLPQTGEQIGIIVAIVVVLGTIGFAYYKYRKLDF